MFFIFGCAGATPQGRLDFRAVMPAQHKISNVPFIPQEINQCGPAALAMVFQYHSAHVPIEELTSQVYSPSLKGSIQPALISSSRRNGFLAYEIYGTENLLKEVSSGSPVIVLQNLGLSWFPLWHYAVVTGYDIEQDSVVLHSGLTPDKEVSIRVFDRTWSGSQHWGLVVLPPTQIPSTATEISYIESVMGLEKAKQWQSAIIGYKTALKSWPTSLHARMGLGNCYYEVGDLESAADVLREATKLSPDTAPAFNNLAQVLSEQGNVKEALDAATKAMTIGGPLQGINQKTYKEIKSKLH
ncbi:MAG: PA2778 family cysteine peptidase [Deltaproteobacteria bacterium]|nr:PA2778 family cysteine peptidase [Deltaproteobacteria bacterium]